MIKINIEEHWLQELETQYKTALTEWLFTKDNADKKKGTADVSPEWIYYIEHLESLITCKPKDMGKQWELFLDVFWDDYEDWLNSSDQKNTTFGKFIKKMTKLYNEFMQYECFDQKNEEKEEKGNKQRVGYWFFESLELDVCPYCNRNYILTVEVDKNKKDKKINYRPEIDHFYPKSRYPIFALSFYNFVPACPTCNHIKRDNKLKVSPWDGYTGENTEPIFRVINTAQDPFPQKPKIEITGGEENDRKTLGIEELYNKHTDVVQDILNRIQAYNTDAYTAVLASFQGIVNTEGELDRMVWGNYTDSNDFSKRPFSKLTSDILKQYKIK